MKGMYHTRCRGQHFSPSRPGDRYLKLSSQKRSPGRNLADHRLVRRSGTASRGPALLVLRISSFPRTGFLPIDLIAKWRPINYSFVCMLISPLRLIFTSKFFCFLYMLKRANYHANQRIIYWLPFWNEVYFVVTTSCSCLTLSLLRGAPLTSKIVWR